VSRGPWVGAAVIVLVFILTGPARASNLASLGLASVACTPILLVTSMGEKIISYLPWVGTIEANTVSYREQLLKVSIAIILENPFFGAYDYLQSEAFESLKDGTGFLDMVNSFAAIGLSSGLVGLSLFLGFFIAVIVAIFRGMRQLPDMTDERHVLGRALIATLIGILVIIFTVSSIMFIPVVYWSVAGLGMAYVQLLASAKQAAAGPATKNTPARAALRPSRLGANARLSTLPGPAAPRAGIDRAGK